MSSTAPPFQLTREQAERLQGYIQTYRQYALTALMPSSGRNLTLRILQAVQGKLIEVIDLPAAPLLVVATREEMAALRAMTTTLLELYAKQPDSTERTAILADLATLLSSLKPY